MPTGPVNLRALASIGAKQRLRELDDERATLLRAFPELTTGDVAGPRRRGRPRKESHRLAVAENEATSHSGTRKRRKMSAAARKRISEAQKARWRKQKAAK
jgi:hypothetical protein